MSEGLRVTVGGLHFWGQKPRGEDAFFLIDGDGFEGWDDGVDVRLTDTARPVAHGSFDLPVFNAARVVSLSGSALADRPQELRQLGARLTGLLAGGASVVAQVERGGDVQWCPAKLGAKPLFKVRGGQGVAEFQLQLWSPDPRKFGNTNTFSMPSGVTVSVFHRGNYPATPRITVTGSMPGYTLTVNGWSYAVSVPLVSGTPHVIDYNDGRLRINGAVVQNSIGNTNLTTIPPGQVITAGLFATSGGSGTATMALLDTYI